MAVLPRGDNVSTVPVRWKVRALLQRHGLSTYRLWKESGLAMGTVYRLARGDTGSLNAETLDRVMEALRRLTGVSLAVSDLLVYEPATVYVLSKDLDVAAVVDDMVRKHHASHYADLVASRGPDGAIEEVLAAWVRFGRAFRSENDAKNHAASLPSGSQLTVHPVTPGDVREILEDMGAIKEDGTP